MKVSVIMPIYNASQYLKQAVDSILSQTIKDWELIAVDDCSSDNSVEILKAYNDPRIKIIQNQTNSGPAVTRNKALRASTGEYIAILDADDISYCQRFEKQIDYLEMNPEISIVGSYANALNEKGEYMFEVKPPLGPKELKTRLLFESAMVHSSAMIRASDLKKYHLFYDENFYYAQDFEMLSRASRYVKLANIPETLVGYRMSPGNISNKNKDKQTGFGFQVIENQFAYYAISVEKKQMEVLYAMLYKFHYLNRNERLSLLRLFRTLFLYLHNSHDFSISVLRYYFSKLYLLSAARKSNSIMKYAIIFDIFFVIRFSAWVHPCKALGLIRFYYLSIFKHYALKHS